MKRYAVDRYSRKVKDIYEKVEGLVPYGGSLETIVKEFVRKWYPSINGIY